MEENDWIMDKMVVTEPGGDSEYRPGQIITLRKLRDDNSMLKRKESKEIET